MTLIILLCLYTFVCIDQFTIVHVGEICPKSIACTHIIIYTWLYTYVYSFLFLVAVPSGSPQDIQVEAQDSRSLLLSWSPPPAGERNGDIVGYKINLTEEETGHTSHYLTTQPFLSLDSLHPFYSYSYTLTALTVLGPGPYSTPASIQMPAEREFSHTHLQIPVTVYIPLSSGDCSSQQKHLWSSECTTCSSCLAGIEWWMVRQRSWLHWSLCLLTVYIMYRYSLNLHTC